MKVGACRSLAVFAVLSVVAPMLAQTVPDGPARMIADINTVPEFSAGSHPREFVQLGSFVVFVAETPDTGWALWRTDGTQAGTALIKAPNPDDYYSSISGLTVMGNAVYFGASDGVHGTELWKSDGTTAGTAMVKDIFPGPNASLLLTALYVYHGELFFKAHDGVHGLELWKSDGTEAGTVLVKDTDPLTTDYVGFTGREILMGEAGGLLFFSSFDHVHGHELWKTDGTEEGTVLVKDIMPGLDSALPANSYVELNGVLYFQAYDPEQGYGLFRTDGTEDGTFLVKALPLGDIVKAGGRLFFGVGDYESEAALWTSDGTEAGTSLVKNTGPTPPSLLVAQGGIAYFFAVDASYLTWLWKSDGTESGTTPITTASYFDLTEAGGRIYFVKGDGAHGDELWTTDGTEAGARLVKDIFPGPNSGLSYNQLRLYDCGGKLYFGADDGTHGIEVWRSGGTASETVLVADVNKINRNRSSAPYEVGRIGGNLYVAADPGTGNAELWRTDGTSRGTARVKSFGTGYGEGVVEYTDTLTIGNTLYFVAEDTAHGDELWKSDGTPEGTVLVKDINTQVLDDLHLGSRPRSFVEHDGKLLFVADDGIHGAELWKSDGTEAGTVMVKDVDPTPESGGTFGPLVPTAGGLVFIGFDVEHLQALWKTDGTTEGTALLKDIDGPPGNFSSIDLNGPTLGGSTFFVADDQTHGAELWKSDGTEAGTVMVKDLCPGRCSESIFIGSYETAIIDGNIYFSTSNNLPLPDFANELWKTDGTEAGTVLVKAFHPDRYSRLAGLTASGGSLFFFANDGVHGPELWKSNGAEVGTVLVRDITPGSDAPNNSYQPLFSAGGTVYFIADDGTHGPEVWRSDGTEQGTFLLRDIRPGPATSRPSGFVTAEGKLIFRADDGEHGYEMWRTDGTSEGTVLVQDIAPGAASSGTAFFFLPPQQVGSHLVFSTNDDSHGYELWSGRTAILTGDPRGAVRDLRGELTGVHLPPGLEKVLSRTLDEADRALAAGNTPAAIDAMRRFRAKVQGLSSHLITDEQRGSLTQFGDDLIAMLERGA